MQVISCQSDVIMYWVEEQLEAEHGLENLDMLRTSMVGKAIHIVSKKNRWIPR